MTEIRIVGSSSNGNGYILKSEENILILELGCNFREYLNCIDITELFGVGDCISSHQHNDHLNKSTLKDVTQRGLSVYVGENVYEGMDEESKIRGLKPLSLRSKTSIGDFIVQPFEVPHNVPNCGFLIETPTKERIVFITDAVECMYKFRDITCIMVECNHDDDTMLENLYNDEVSRSQHENHMSFEKCMAFCKANVCDKTERIILIHPSKTNVNEIDVLDAFKREFPLIETTFAKKQDTIEIGIHNF